MKNLILSEKYPLNGFQKDIDLDDGGEFDLKVSIAVPDKKGHILIKSESINIGEVILITENYFHSTNHVLIVREILGEDEWAEIICDEYPNSNNSFGYSFRPREVKEVKSHKEDIKV